MRRPLPVYIYRRRFVSEATAGLKASKQAHGAEVISGAQNFDALPDIDVIAENLGRNLRT
jgi:hypothetical protein